MRRRLVALAGAVALAALRAERSYAAKVAADPRCADLLPIDAADIRRVRSADGTELHTLVHGPAGAPTVVLVHGWACSSAFWTRQIRGLSDLRLVTYDQRGHGSSGGTSESFSTHSLADDLQAVLEAVLAEHERAVLVGHSMGAMSIAAWAGRYPDQVERRASRALLISTGVDRLSLDATFLPLPARFAAVQGRVQKSLLASAVRIAGPWSVQARGTRWLSLSPAATPAEVDFCARQIRAMQPQARAAWSRVLGDLDLTPDLAALTVPTTVVVGTADRLTPPAYARRLARLLPMLQELVELPGVGHMSPIEAADDVNDLIRAQASERVTQ